MSRKLHIDDTNILRDLQRSLEKFASESTSILKNIDNEIRGVQEKINQRVYYWERQVQSANKSLQQAESALRRCEASGYYDKDGHYYAPDCSSEMRALQAAVQDLRDCQHKLNKTKEWRSKVQQGVQDYNRSMGNFQNYLAKQNQDSSKYLSQAAAKYESVHQFSGDMFSGITKLPTLGILSDEIVRKSDDYQFGDSVVLGPYADKKKGFVDWPYGSSRDFDSIRDDIQQKGQLFGCHTCGTKNPGRTGKFVPDHQPPIGLNFTNEPTKLYPQCNSCSSRQGGEVRWVKDSLFKLIFYKVYYDI